MGRFEFPFYSYPLVGQWLAHNFECFFHYVAFLVPNSEIFVHVPNVSGNERFDLQLDVCDGSFPFSIVGRLDLLFLSFGHSTQ